MVLPAGCKRPAKEKQDAGKKAAAARATKSRVFILGLDGLDWDRLNRLMEQDKLPNIKKLHDAGAYGGIRTDDLFYLSPIVWTTIATGVEQRTHGVQDFFRYEDGKRIPYSGLNLKAPPLWEMLSNNGMQSIVLGWWITRYSNPGSAVILSDRLAGKCKPTDDDLYPNDFILEKAWDTCTKPYSLEDVRSIIDISKEEFKALNIEDKKKLKAYQQIARREDFYTEAGLEIMARGMPFKLFAIYFRGPDGVGHLATRYRDYSGFEPDAEMAARAMESMNNIYVFLDERLGRILKHVTDDDYVIVISDHGFGDDPIQDQGPVHPGPFFKHSFLLERLGFITYKNECGEAIAPEQTYIFEEGMRDPAEFPLAISMDGYQFFAVEKGMIKYTVPSFLKAIARVKTVGGAPLVSNIRALRRDKPWERGDMTVLKFNVLQASDVLEINGKRHHINQFLRTRPSALFHRYPGVFMITGPGIKLGPLAQPTGYYDVAPTVLYALGLPVPAHMDGKVMDWVFTPDFLKRNKITKGPAIKHKAPNPDSIPDKAERDKKYLEELKELGYIE
jgi:predicted AlkP superfamily phosphohydrolase/phosphomutase